MLFVNICNRLLCFESNTTQNLIFPTAVPQRCWVNTALAIHVYIAYYGAPLLKLDNTMFLHATPQLAIVFDFDVGYIMLFVLIFWAYLCALAQS